MARKYKKSLEQCEKERERRRKLRETVLNAPHYLSQTELAKILGCSQATVSRDLKILSRSRWDPFRQREREIRKLIMSKRYMSRLIASQWVAELSEAEALKKALQIMGSSKERAKKLIQRWLKKNDA